MPGSPSVERRQPPDESSRQGQYNVRRRHNPTTGSRETDRCGEPEVAISDRQLDTTKTTPERATSSPVAGYWRCWTLEKSRGETIGLYVARTPSRAGRSPYHSEPSIERLKLNTLSWRRNPIPPVLRGDRRDVLAASNIPPVHVRAALSRLTRTQFSSHCTPSTLVVDPGTTATPRLP